MKHIAAAALLAFAGSALPGSVLAQTAPAAPPAAPAPAAAAQPRPVPGLSAATLTAWLATQGATAEPVKQDGDRRYMRVTADGLPWILFMQSCDGDVCSDLQFTAGLANAQVTPEKINDWNRDRRFMKAVYEPAEPGGQPSALAQFDVLVPSGGVAELTDPLAIWRSLLPEFVRVMTTDRTTATPTAAPAAPGG